MRVCVIRQTDNGGGGDAPAAFLAAFVSFPSNMSHTETLQSLSRLSRCGQVRLTGAAAGAPPQHDHLVQGESGLLPAASTSKISVVPALILLQGCVQIIH